MHETMGDTHSNYHTKYNEDKIYKKAIPHLVKKNHKYKMQTKKSDYVIEYEWIISKNHSWNNEWMGGKDNTEFVINCEMNYLLGKPHF